MPCVSLVVAMMLPNWVIALIRRPYQQALRRGIPDALDLLVVCAEAGLGLESAVERVAQEMRQSNRPVGVEFSLLTHEMRILPDRRIALTNLAERTGQPALKRLAGTIAQTLKYGTPLSQGLRTLAAEMRNERMIQFEERAGKLPALLVMPMIAVHPALSLHHPDGTAGHPAHGRCSQACITDRRSGRSRHGAGGLPSRTTPEPASSARQIAIGNAVTQQLLATARHRRWRHRESRG